MNILLTLDRNYLSPMQVMLFSLLLNNPGETFDVYVISDDLTLEDLAPSAALSARFSSRLHLIPADDALFADAPVIRYYSKAMYYRLLAADLLPQALDRVLYLDPDMLIIGRLRPLYDMPIGDMLYAAAIHRGLVDLSTPVNRVRLSAYEAKGYFNSGVLLMNLAAMRQHDLEQHFLTLLNTYHFDSIAPDQDYLNAMCNGKIHYLDASWDTMPNDAKPPLAHTNLIHYNLFSKPWCYDGIQYADEFWHYASDSGYIDEIRAFKAAYSDEKKAEDRACLELLIRRGTEIPENDITFKKMRAKGVKIRL